MIRSSYNSEENIIYLNRIGEIEIQDLFAMVGEVTARFKDLKSLYILDDVRESTSKFKSVDYPGLLLEIKKGLGPFLEVRHAILVDTPMETVLSILFEDLAKDVDSYSFKVFTTKESGKSWLIDSFH